MHSCLTQRRPIEVCRQPERLKHRSHLESFSTAILLQYSHFPFACENGKTCERKSITARQSNGNGSVYSSGTALEKNVSAFASRAKCASPLLCESVRLPDIYSSFHPMLGITFDSEYASNFFWARLSDCTGCVSWTLKRYMTLLLSLVKTPNHWWLTSEYVK